MWPSACGWSTGDEEAKILNPAEVEGMAVRIEGGVRAIIDLEAPHTVHIHGVTPEEFEEVASRAEGIKVELMDGVMIVHSPEKTRHERIFMFLATLVNVYVRARGLGEVLGSMETVHLSECRRVKPDLLFVSKERISIVTEDHVRGAPDLVVEIPSESTRHEDLGMKRPIYREAGVREVWLVDYVERRVIVDRRRDGEYEEEVLTSGELRSEAVEGLRLKVDWLWRDPLPDPVECLKEVGGA